MSRSLWILLCALLIVPVQGFAALPRRLILALDGITYRDMKALQEGVPDQDSKGRQRQIQAFHDGYFPVSRLVSTFPSTSDVAWTDIFANPPLPGYQRTYFSWSANARMAVNGVTTSMEYERQMNWRLRGSFRHTMSFVFPLPAFRYEVREFAKDFLATESGEDNYYVLIGATDNAQHLSGDIRALLCELNDQLQDLRARYRAREGRDLEILILSDHGNNHAGAGRRIAIRSFLKKAGYRIATSILQPKDVVLPTAGIESWVELHNAPTETETLLQRLCSLEGVDILTGRCPNAPHRFIVMNSLHQRALIDWNPDNNSFRYSPQTGDPIGYRPALEALSKHGKLDTDGFASADDWMAESLTHRYPLALERIARAHTCVTLNPATILISLRNDHVHAGWWVKKGSEFVTFGGTHGGLDDLNSTGILLSNFQPTQDTSTRLVAKFFGGFPGRSEYRVREDGAAWTPAHPQSETAQGSADPEPERLDPACLRIWTPQFARLRTDTPIAITVQKTPPFLQMRIRAQDAKAPSADQHFVLPPPMACPAANLYERVYALPRGMALEPHQMYRISGRITGQNKSSEIFRFAFRTDNRGQPLEPAQAD